MTSLCHRAIQYYKNKTKNKKTKQNKTKQKTKKKKQIKKLLSLQYQPGRSFDF